MKKFVITNTVTGEKQTVYTDGTSAEAKKSVCSCNGWETIDCTVRFVG